MLTEIVEKFIHCFLSRCNSNPYPNQKHTMEMKLTTAKFPTVEFSIQNKSETELFSIMTFITCRLGSLGRQCDRTALSLPLVARRARSLSFVIRENDDGSKSRIGIILVVGFAIVTARATGGRSVCRSVVSGEPSVLLVVGVVCWIITSRDSHRSRA